MKAIPSRRIYDFPAKKYSTGLAQLLMKAIEDVTARLFCHILSNLNEIKKKKKYSFISMFSQSLLNNKYILLKYNNYTQFLEVAVKTCSKANTAQY